MAILAIEGFTGVPRATTNVMASPHPLNTLGWTMNCIYNGSTVVTASDTNHQSIIEADPVFATRSRLQIKADMTGTSVSNYLQQYRYATDTSGYTKFVLGGMFTVENNVANTNPIDLVLSGASMWPASNGSFPLNEIIAQIRVPSSTAAGSISTQGGTMTTNNAVVNKKATHVEALVEQDVKRVRVYLDGTLAIDATYNGTFAAVAGGFSIIMFQANGGQVAQWRIRASDLYMLGVDAIHTGPVGPAARVLEVAPTQDKTVEWQRPASFASNAAVLQQNYNEASPAYVTAGDPATDLYGVINAVGANAAKIYGAAIKVQAQSMAEGTHNITSVAQSGTDTAIGTKNYPLSLLVNKPFVMDVSKNPTTGVAWTPTEITAASIGFRLVN